MTKIYYLVKMTYCGGCLGTSKGFDRFSKANEFALECAKDEDNTYITVEEVEIKGFFKKSYNSKLIVSYNEF